MVEDAASGQLSVHRMLHSYTKGTNIKVSSTKKMFDFDSKTQTVYEQRRLTNTIRNKLSKYLMSFTMMVMIRTILAWHGDFDVITVE